MLSDKDFFKQLKKECRELSNGEDIDEGFPLFCLKIFFPDLSSDLIESSIYGLETNDESIDAFFVLEETKKIYFAQFKSSNSMDLKPVKKEWLSYLYDVPNKLANSEFIDQHRNPRVKEIAAEYLSYESKFQPNFAFFHMGYNPNPEIIESYKNFRYYAFEDIKEQYQEYISKESLTEPETIFISLTYDIDPEKVEKKVGRHHTFISIITGDEIIRLRDEFKYKLFDKNLRFSLGNNKINSQIVRTSLCDRPNFYFFNNGITITSKFFKWNDVTKKVRIDYPQIINGAQTVDAIYSAFKERENKLKRELKNYETAHGKAIEEFKELKVLFRIIQNDKHDDFERKVIEYNNTQNAIKKRDFYANATEQIELQKYFAKFGYFYEIKRGERDYIKTNKHNILNKTIKEFEHKEEKLDIERLASLWMAYHVMEPGSKEVGKDYIFGEDKYYDLVFPTNTAEINDNLVKEMILATNIFSLVEIESKIFTGVNSILSLLSELNNNSKFEKVKFIVDNSLIFNKTLKSKFRDFDSFNKSSKETVVDKIKNYSPFANGKYVVVAVFKLIIDQCDYLDTLIMQTNLFSNKSFIKEKIVANWLVTILDDLLVPEYASFIKEFGASTGAFYFRSKTFDNIKSKFNGLDIDKDKPYKEIFPLIL